MLINIIYTLLETTIIISIICRKSIQRTLWDTSKFLLNTTITNIIISTDMVIRSTIITTTVFLRLLLAQKLRQAGQTIKQWLKKSKSIKKTRLHKLNWLKTFLLDYLYQTPLLRTGTSLQLKRWTYQLVNLYQIQHLKMAIKWPLRLIIKLL